MRLAALYDIHGNLPALEAVLDEVRDARVDRIVVGGDVVPGPMVRETIDRVLDLGVPTLFIQGNCEVAVLAARAGLDPGKMPESAKRIVRWAADQLRPDDVRTLGGWPMTVTVAVDGIGDVLFCHGTPRHENDIFTRLTPESALLPIFGGLGVPLVICGHTHMQDDRTIGPTRVVNAGSVGMPFGEPGADWLLIGPGVELRHTPYDLARAAERIRATPYPDAEAFANGSVLHPPPAEQMLEAFTRAGIQ